MKVIIAKYAGFCFGVKRALDLVNSEVDAGRRTSTLGPLIHNPQVVKYLEDKGVKVVSSVSEADGGIVMPSHGVSKETIKQALDLGLNVVDAACPFVTNVVEKVAKLSADGYEVVMVGDAGHTEVKAIMSAAGESAVVVSSIEDAIKLKWNNKRVGVVSQTTQSPSQFGEIVGYISSRASETLVYNTICYATLDRQNDAAEIARQVDAMVVVGGKNSANTNRLAHICAEIGVPTYHIETASEINKDWFIAVNTVGLTAGASTPDWIIDEVCETLEAL